MDNKYGFTGAKKTINGKTLKQIVCLTAFASVCVGDIGGWIEKESNLAHSGDAWVFGNAWVYGNARVRGDARVYGNAKVYGDARVFGNAWVYGNARVHGNARVYGDARVYGNAEVYGDARVYGDACAFGGAKVFGNAEVHGNAEVYDNTKVYGGAKVFGNAWVYGNARVYGDAEVLTKHAVNITSSDYTVTITDTHITIGCQSHEKDFWRDADFEIIEKIDGKASAERFMKFKPFLMMLADIE